LTDDETAAFLREWDEIDAAAGIATMPKETDDDNDSDNPAGLLDGLDMTTEPVGETDTDAGQNAAPDNAIRDWRKAFRAKWMHARDADGRFLIRNTERDVLRLIIPMVKPDAGTFWLSREYAVFELGDEDPSSFQRAMRKLKSRGVFYEISPGRPGNRHGPGRSPVYQVVI